MNPYNPFVPYNPTVYPQTQNYISVPTPQNQPLTQPLTQHIHHHWLQYGHIPPISDYAPKPQITTKNILSTLISKFDDNEKTKLRLDGLEKNMSDFKSEVEAKFDKFNVNMAQNISSLNKSIEDNRGLITMMNDSINQNFASLKDSIQSQKAKVMIQPQPPQPPQPQPQQQANTNIQSQPQQPQTPQTPQPICEPVPPNVPTATFCYGGARTNRPRQPIQPTQPIHRPQQPIQPNQPRLPIQPQPIQPQPIQPQPLQPPNDNNRMDLDVSEEDDSDPDIPMIDLTTKQPPIKQKFDKC